MRAMIKRHFQDAKTVVDFGNYLAKVIKGGALSQEEGQALTYNLAEMEESCCNYLEEYMPKLIAEKDPQKIEDLLIDIGEEFRHMLYHIKNTKFYDYLNEDATDNKQEKK